MKTVCGSGSVWLTALQMPSARKQPEYMVPETPSLRLPPAPSVYPNAHMPCVHDELLAE